MIAPVFASFAILQAAPTAAIPQMIFMYGAIFAIFYFVLIRPQQKQRKQHEERVKTLKKGDEIVTAGGLLGKVSKIGDAYIGVELASGVEVQMQRNAVVQVLPKGTIK